MPQPLNLTDINDGTIFTIDKEAVRSFYDIEIYRMVVMESGTVFDVSETFAYLVTEIGGGGPPI